MTQRHLFCFGLGYSAETLIGSLDRTLWQVSGTCRTPEKQQAWQAQGVKAHLWADGATLPDVVAALADVSHILLSVPPEATGDPVLQAYGGVLTGLSALRWVGYLGTTGVYGDCQGAWVDEDSPCQPASDRGARRLAAEQAWLASGLPVQIFRLAGIYGPGRNLLAGLRAGTARRVIKPGQVFSRIHVDDIAATLLASINQPRPGRIYNVCDDEPAAPDDVLLYAASLLGVTPPPAIPFDQAELSPMARSFYADNKKVSNRRIREELQVQLKHPTYRAGLQALLAQGK